MNHFVSLAIMVLLCGCTHTIVTPCPAPEVDWTKKPARQILTLSPQSRPDDIIRAYEHDAAEWPAWAAYLETVLRGYGK